MTPTCLLLINDGRDRYVICALSNDTDKDVASRNISMSEDDLVVIPHLVSQLL
jgi:hypothetical protein